MKIYLLKILICLLLVNGSSLNAQKKTKECTITYIANEGFLIETKSSKVLIDALFGGIKGNWCDQPGDSVSNLVLKGLAPFDNIDVVLVTHKHSDHFNAPMIINFLKNNQKSILICPDQVNQLLKSDTDYSKVSSRIHALKTSNPFDTLVAVNKVKFRILRLNHGAYMETDSITGKKYNLHSGVENLGYCIEIDGFSILHTGDGSPSTNKELYKGYGLADKDLDIAFLDRVFLGREGQELMSEVIHSKNIVFMHIEPGRGEYYKSIIKSIPEMCVFVKTNEKKLFFKE